MNSASSPTLSIIIASYNTRELLAGCLESLRRVADEIEFEVIVVDNASADGSAQMVREQFPEVKLIEAGRNAGFAAANNIGLAQAKGKFLFFLNPDTIVPRGTLVQLLRPLSPALSAQDVEKGSRGSPKLAVMGARLVNPDGTKQPSVFEFPNLWREFWNFLPEIKSTLQWMQKAASAFLPIPVRHSRGPRRVECVSGAAMLVRADAMREVNGFDEGFFLYHEERDLCYRLRDAGWEIWTMPSATIIHYDAQASGYKTSRFPREPILSYRILGMDRLYQKHRPGWQHKVWRLRSRNMLRMRAMWWRVKGDREGARELTSVAERLKSGSVEIN